MEHPLLGAVVELMMASERHRGDSVADIERLIVPPLKLGQRACVWVNEGLVAFASYALLSDEAEDGFISGSRRLQASDWRSGEKLWLMDAIAPYGHARGLCGELREKLRERGFAGRPIRFRRNYHDGGPRRYASVIV